jgi:hypothetical protein
VPDDLFRDHPDDPAQAAEPDAALERIAWWRYLWVGPTTGVGLLVALAALVTGGRVRRVGGVLECSGGAARTLLRARPLRAGAITLGHVVAGVDERTLERWRAHELVHVRQAERWGPLFIPAYLVAGLWAGLRGGNPYRDNPFEIEAREKGGG